MTDELKGIVVGATAVSALIAGLVGLGFDLEPEWRPDPRTQLAANVEVVGLEPRVRFGEYRRRTSASPAAYRRWPKAYVSVNSAEGLKIAGNLVYVRLGVRGYKGRDVAIQWSAYDVRRNARVLAPREDDRRTTQASLDAPSDEFVAEMWTQTPPGPGRYFVRVEVRDRTTSTLLVMADSRRLNRQATLGRGKVGGSSPLSR